MNGAKCLASTEAVHYIDTAVNPVGRLVPINLPRAQLEAKAPPITIFDGNGITAEDHGHSMKWVTMPWHNLARRKT